LPAGHFAIRHAETKLHDHVYHLNADLDYQFSDVILDALRNSISITLVLEITVEQSRDYLWDNDIATLKQTYRIRYHKLSQRYIITNLNTQLNRSYQSIHSGLRKLGEIRHFPLLDAELIKSDKAYIVSLKTHLDIEALPAPLRPIAYFTDEWRLKSEIYTCPLIP